jgi:hypothetical protein
LYQQGATAELTKGTDPNGDEPDIEIQFNPDYLQNELFFDPDPFSRTATVPFDRTDAYSVILHEFGHAFSFNGFRSHTDASLPGNFQSTFDLYELFDGEDIFFNGLNARRLHGGPLPVTFGNNWHLGNQSPRPGADLVPDLMNGVVFQRGTQYSLSALDLAIFMDTQLVIDDPDVIPEPGTWMLSATGILVVAAGRRRRWLWPDRHRAVLLRRERGSDRTAAAD